MRVVLDVNVLISALISPSGTPARIILAWQAGRFDLIVSPLLLEELGRALAYPKLRRRITADEARRFVGWLSRDATVVDDPGQPPLVRSVDPGDDYLLSLAAAADALLVSGDDHLLSIRSGLPIHSSAAFIELLGRSDQPGSP